MRRLRAEGRGVSENSKIEWTDHTYNPWRGCTKVSPGCKNCYAEALSRRNPKVLGEWGEGATRALSADSYRELPFKWNRAAARDGVRRKAFTLSLGDWLDGEVPIGWLYGLLSDVLDNESIDWLMLTKRPENWEWRLAAVLKYVPDARIRLWLDGEPPHNVWLGVSAEDQERADERVPILLTTPASVRFVSYEPALGPIDFTKISWPAPDPRRMIRPVMGDISEYNALTGEFIRGQFGMRGSRRLDWIIFGGESGGKKRPVDLTVARQTRDDCKRFGVAFFMKQVDKVQPIPDDLMIREFPRAV